LLQGPDHQLNKIIIGVDVAGKGNDNTVASVRWCNTVLWLKYWSGVVTDETEKMLTRLAHQLEELGYSVEMYVDAPGLGQGVIDHLRSNGLLVYEYWPQEKPPSDQKRYSNLKAWMHFKMRVNLLEGKEAFYPLSNLRSELMQSKYDYTKDDKIEILKPSASKKSDSDQSPDFCDSYVISGVPLYGRMSPEENLRLI
ncbi:MAG: hypothetical protein K9L56_15800, partial [Clostridiales bacterium]|nr:hypothetical protein [Clostridiales bacterium]